MSNYDEPAPRQTSNVAVIVAVLLIVLLLVGLACGGIGVAMYFLVSEVQREMEPAMLQPDVVVSDQYGESFSESLSLMYQERYAEAVQVLDEALLVEPDNPLLLNQVAWLLATCPDASVRDGERAIELARRACELTDYETAAIVDTLAAAHAEAGDFDTAVEWQTKALEASPQASDVRGMRRRLGLYQDNIPYREAAGGRPVTDEVPGQTDSEPTE